MTLNPILVWAIVSMLSACSLLSSMAKMFAWPRKLFATRREFMRACGIDRRIVVFVGIAEFCGAVTIWFQPGIIGLVGAILIAGTSTGTIGLHVFFDSWKKGILSIVTLALSAALAFYNWPLSKSMQVAAS